jgi:hypothetical protein
MEKLRFLASQLFLRHIERDHWVKVVGQYRTQTILTDAFCEFYECSSSSSSANQEGAAFNKRQLLIFGNNRVSLMSLKVHISVLDPQQQGFVSNSNKQTVASSSSQADKPVPFLLFEIDNEMYLVDHTLIDKISKVKPTKITSANANSSGLSLPTIRVDWPGVVMVWCFNADHISSTPYSPEQMLNTSAIAHSNSEYYTRMVADAIKSISNSLQGEVYMMPGICRKSRSLDDTAATAVDTPSSHINSNIYYSHLHQTGTAIDGTSVSLQLAQSTGPSSSTNSSSSRCDGFQQSPVKRRKLEANSCTGAEHEREMAESIISLSKFIERTHLLLSGTVAVDEILTAFWLSKPAESSAKKQADAAKCISVRNNDEEVLTPPADCIHHDLDGSANATTKRLGQQLNNISDSYMGSLLPADVASEVRQAHEAAISACEKKIQSDLQQLYAPLQRSVTDGNDKVFGLLVFNVVCNTAC